MKMSTSGGEAYEAFGLVEKLNSPTQRLSRMNSLSNTTSGLCFFGSTSLKGRDLGLRYAGALQRQLGLRYLETYWLVSHRVRSYNISTVSTSYLLLHARCNDTPVSFHLTKAALETCSFLSAGTSTSSGLAMRYWLSTAQLVRPSHSTHLGHGADDISIR